MLSIAHIKEITRDMRFVRVSLFRILLIVAAVFVVVSCGGDDSGRVHDLVFVSKDSDEGLSILERSGEIDRIVSEPATDPAWAPSQGRLAYLANSGVLGGELKYWDRGGSSPRRVPGSPGNVVRFFWSPDSRSIAYQADSVDGIDTEIYVYDFDIDETSLVASEPSGRLELGNWSGDTEWLSMRLVTEDNMGIFMRAVRGVDEVQLSEGDDFSPRFSPDGRKLAFSRVQGDGSSDIYTLIVDDGDGESSEPVNVSRERGDEVQFEWSPNGRHIVYLSDRDGNFEIYAIDLDKDETVRLTQNRVQDVNVRWSRDGGHLLFASDADGDFDLFSMEFASRVQRKALSTDVDERVADW